MIENTSARAPRNFLPKRSPAITFFDRSTGSGIREMPDDAMICLN